MYAKCFKRVFDFALSFLALIVLSPVLLILTVLGTIRMKGNPFFAQPRPGKNEKVFNLIKFRTMTNEKDSTGKPLSDEVRLNGYGRFLRKTSLDELPELINILVGNMAVVGPRPLLVKYLPRYSQEQRHRHDVRPGLTGYAQVHGRNAITWDEKFKLDLEYIRKITLVGDIKIILATVVAVLHHSGISSETSVTMEEFIGSEQEVEKVGRPV